MEKLVGENSLWVKSKSKLYIIKNVTGSGLEASLLAQEGQEL